MKLVLDTSIIVDRLRGGNHWDQFKKSTDKGTELCIPTVVVFELFSGSSTKTTGQAKKIQNMLRFFQKIEINERIARRAGEIYRDVSSHFSVADYLIAATALEIGGLVVTLNKKHFENIPGIRIYDPDAEI